MPGFKRLTIGRVKGAVEKLGGARKATWSGVAKLTGHKIPEVRTLGEAQDLYLPESKRIEPSPFNRYVPGVQDAPRSSVPPEPIPETLRVNWDTLRQSSFRMIEFPFMDWIRGHYFRPAEQLIGWDAALAILDSVKRALVERWLEPSGPTPGGATAPAVYRSIRGEDIAPLIVINTLLEEIETRTQGVFSHRIVPADELELIEAILATPLPEQSRPIVEAWSLLDATKERLLERIRRGGAIEELLFVLGGLIRALTLAHVARGAVDDARTRLEGLLSETRTRVRLKSFRASLPGQDSSRIPVELNGTGPAAQSTNPYPRLADLRLLLEDGKRAPTPREELLLRTAELAQAVLPHLERFFQAEHLQISQHAAQGITAVREVVASILEDLDEMVTYRNEENSLFLSELIGIAAEVASLHSLGWLPRWLATHEGAPATVR